MTAPLTEFFVGVPPHQMYVQHWRASPAAPSRKGPLVMVHGGSHTGTTWTTTPDGRPGWAMLFVERGWDVHVVDWPGVGRSGFQPDNLAETPIHIIEALALLLQRIGPAAMVGHSMGGALSIKLAERLPEMVRAIAGLAPASAETVSTLSGPSPVDTPAIVNRDGARQRYANGTRFPHHAFEEYFASLVGCPPRLRNAAIGVTGEFRIDRTRTDLWNKRIPVLVLAAEEDHTVPPSRLTETTTAMGVPMTMLGADWGLAGHGHLFPVEEGSETIAARVEAWLSEAVRG